MKSVKLTAEAVAAELNELLQAFENDPKLNVSRENSGGMRPLWSAHARANVKKGVNVCYTSYHGSTSLTFEEALGYLNWLKEGDRWKTNGFPRLFEYRDAFKREDPDNYATIAQKDRRPGFTDQFGNTYGGAVESYFALLEAFAPKIPKPQKGSKYSEDLIPKYGKYESGTVSWHVMEKHQRQAAQKMFDDIQQAIRDAYAIGKEHGQSALSQLVRGEITVGDFEKKPSTKIKRDFSGRIIQEGQ